MNAPADVDVPALVASLRAAGLTVAVAESLTGGLVAAAITDVPGASATFRGSVTAYATEIKHQLLGVDAELLAREGAVHPDVAAGMADGVRGLLGADIGVGTTGVAGPDPQDGQPVGTVYVAVSDARRTVVTRPHCVGDRSAIRAAATRAALASLSAMLTDYEG
jgi:nicotinamide-nucleotide amidase